jgi:hypothetical protein
MRTNHRFLVLPLSAAVLVAALVIGGLFRAQATGLDPLCSIPLPALPADKAAQLQQRCARQEADRQKPAAPRGYDPAVPTDLPQSSVGGPIYGITDGGNPYPWSGDDVFANTWWGTNVVVFAGSLKSDRSQGIVVIADRIIGQVPLNPKTYLSPHKDGTLRVTEVNGQILTLAAADSASYQLDLTTHVLSPA